MKLASIFSRLETVAILASVLLFFFFWVMIGQGWIANLPSLLRDVSWLGIVAVGTAMVITSGEFDLSVGSVYAFVSMIFLLLIQGGITPFAAFLLSMALSAGIGWLNGILSWVFKLPSLLVTLGFLFVYRGLVEWVTGGFTLVIPEEIQSHWLLIALGGKGTRLSQFDPDLCGAGRPVQPSHVEDAIRQPHLCGRGRHQRCNRDGCAC